jgi:hypothetical protein
MIPLGKAAALVFICARLRHLLETVAADFGLAHRQVRDLSRSVFADDEVDDFHGDDGALR